MITTQFQQPTTVELFLEQCPEDGCYELVHGEIVRVLATRQPEDVADFIAKRLVKKWRDRGSATRYLVALP
ncbi:hypothetical protein [Trichothermofontia sp.]